MLLERWPMLRMRVNPSARSAPLRRRSSAERRTQRGLRNYPHAALADRSKSKINQTSRCLRRFTSARVSAVIADDLQERQIGVSGALP